jgi:CubicO group peptidase (beta-lactamase class C family)
MVKNILVVSLVFLFAGCIFNIEAKYDYQPPVNADDGLVVGTLDEVQMDELLIERGIFRILQGRYNEVHSVLIFKNNKLVLEEYFDGYIFQWDAPGYRGELVTWNRDMLHSMMSCTKSFTSACIGIAIDEGFIDNANQTIFDYLPDHQQLKTNNREYIKIENLLTMTAGLAWDEWSAAHGTAANDIDSLYLNCDDPVTCVLEKPWWAEPGKLFTYNGGGTVILGEIIRNATGMNIDDFSKQFLFGPLGINSTEWTQYENGVYDTAGSLKITPRDMMKFGVTYLNDGTWNSERIISTDWIEKSSNIYKNNSDINVPSEDSGNNGYGFSWWISKFDDAGDIIKMFRAGGWGGQEIMVFPELELVVVFTGGNYDKNSLLYRFIERYIIPALN